MGFFFPSVKEQREKGPSRESFRGGRTSVSSWRSLFPFADEDVPQDNFCQGWYGVSQGQAAGAALGGQWCKGDQKDIPTPRRFFLWRWKLFHRLFLSLWLLKFLEQHVLPVGDFSMDGNKLGAWARAERMVGGRRGCGRDGNAADETQTPPQPHGHRAVCPHTPLLPKSSRIHWQMRL